MQRFFHAVKFWFYHQTKQNNYVLKLMFAAILLTTAVMTLSASLLFYSVIDGGKAISLINLAIFFLALLLLLLIFFVSHGGLVLLSYVFVFILGSSFAVIALIFPGDATPYIFWFSVIPSVMAFRRSLFDIVVAVILATVSAAIVYASIHRESTEIGYWAFFALHPDRILLIAVVFLYSVALVSFEYFLINLHEKSLYQARFDHLTGLQNRYYLEKEVQLYFEHYRYIGKHFYLLFADLDRFKEINDLFGHKIGDTVLKQIGERLTAFCQGYNQYHTDQLEVFRFGGDEFLFLLFPASGSEAEDLPTLITAVNTIMLQPYDLEKYQIDIGVSMGIAKSGANASSPEELIEFADFAMYNNKQTGKLNFPAGGHEPRLFVEEQMQRQFAIFNELKQALARNEFSLVYQPVYEVSTLNIVGCEVLIRWDSPRLGQITPDQFISMAESTGTIHAISQWVLQTTLRDITPVLQANPELTVSVNWSPYLLDNANSLEFLQQLFSGEQQRYLANIELEITESAPFLHNRYIVRNLTAIKALGLSLALDDYGQGSTSLLTLKNSVFRTVKIDKALLQEAMTHQHNRDILQAAVSAVRSLKLAIVAEGIETQAHLELARDLQCDRVQGFLLSRPVTISQFILLVQQQKVA